MAFGNFKCLKPNVEQKLMNREMHEPHERDFWNAIEFLSCAPGVSLLVSFDADESGAKATALQTLRDIENRVTVAKRLECGAFTAAFARTRPDDQRPRRPCPATPKPKLNGTGFSFGRCR
jgi:hypothetical protein